jgi:hypothetical protein
MSTPLIFMTNSLLQERRRPSADRSVCQEVVHVNAGLPEDRTQGAFRNVTGVARHDRQAFRRDIDPAFVTAFRCSLRNESTATKTRSDVAVAEP